VHAISACTGVGLFVVGLFLTYINLRLTLPQYGACCFEVSMSQPAKNVHCASSVGKSLGSLSLADESSGDAEAVTTDQFLPTYLFGQRHAFTGQCLGQSPVFAVQLQSSKIASVGSQSLGETDGFGYPQCLAIVPLRRREISRILFGNGEAVQISGDVDALGRHTPVQDKRLTV